MSPTSIDARRATRSRASAATLAAMAITALAIAGCAGGPARTDPAAAAVGPDPAAVAAYDAARAALASGDEAAAERDFAALATSHPDYAGPLVNLAALRARRGELEPAAELLGRAVAVCARCAVAWNELGVVQRRQGRFAEAEKAYLQSIAAEEGYAPAWFNLGVLYELYLQRPELAVDRYTRYRALAADGPDAGNVDKWIADLQRRAKTVERSAQLEDTP